MQISKESSPPASTIQIALAHTQPSVSQISKPSKKVKVLKKGNTFGFLKSLQSKKKITEPNCTKSKNIQISGNMFKSISINCEGCAFSSDLTDPHCRLMCSLILSRESCNTLTLDNGYYKKEYAEKDIRKLKEVQSLAESLDMKFPDECGECGKEHEKQLAHLKEAALKDLVRLINSGIEVEENEGMTVKGVESEVCQNCRKRVEEKAFRIMSQLQCSEVAREGYRFSPTVRPFFASSKILLELPERSKTELEYVTNRARVIISSGTEEVYSIFPPEYMLNKNQLQILKTAHNNVVKKAGVTEDSQFAVLCRSEILSAASKLGYNLSDEDSRLMTENLVRCTLGLDVIELLLRDPNLQDVYINSPIDTTPLYVKHKDFDDCRTNVFINEQAARNIISKFRLRSGRAFSEVSPILDMELPEFGVRVNITGPPISPDGLAFAFRRASEEPWTLLRFLENSMISPLAAGLLGMMVNEETAILMCGDRGSGKTSMLTALVGAMPAKYRILTMEDTFEIPVPTLATQGGFRIQRMKIRPSTAGESFELKADDAMRSLLRMGDSAIVMGEVRGEEARTLYEAMNVGGSGNCVLGTIHGKSPRGLLERVVFSLGVPPQSFKATDLVVIADRIRPGGGSRKLRRVTEIVEVRKSWKEPDAEKVFSSLMKYDQDNDMLVPTESFIDPRKSEVIMKIANKRGVAAEVIMNDVKARAGVYDYAVQLFRKTADKKLLAMRTLVELNMKYLQLVDESIRAYGSVEYGFVEERAKSWLNDFAKVECKKNSNEENGLCETVQGIAET